MGSLFWSGSCLDLHGCKQSKQLCPLQTRWSSSLVYECCPQNTLKWPSFLSEPPAFDLVPILLLQSTLRAVFVGEKCTTNAIYYWYGLILRPAVQRGVCFSPVWVLLCSTLVLTSWQLVALVLFYGSVDRTWCRFIGQMCLEGLFQFKRNN